jgi:hypothetical protein
MTSLTKAHFDLINAEIDKLVDKLTRKGVCRCCIANGMLFHGGFLMADTIDESTALEVLDDVAAAIGWHDDDGIAMPTGSTAH